MTLDLRTNYLGLSLAHPVVPSASPLTADVDHLLRLAEAGLRPMVERFVASGHAPPGDTLPEILAAFDTHVGTPEDVITSLSADTTLSRVTDLVFPVHSVDPPHPLILRSIELIATEVAPALGWQRPIVAPERRVALVR